jgi:hypothetical protein
MKLTFVIILKTTIPKYNATPPPPLLQCLNVSTGTLYSLANYCYYYYYGRRRSINRRAQAREELVAILLADEQK